MEQKLKGPVVFQLFYSGIKTIIRIPDHRNKPVIPTTNFRGIKRGKSSYVICPKSIYISF